jgi:hypothetical protein
VSGVERAEQAVVEARKRIWWPPMPDDDARIANATLNDLISAVREAERQRYLHQPILKTCCAPGCLRQFDSLNGGAVRPEWSTDGWKFMRLSSASHICPTHAPLLDEHMPQWEQRQDDRSRLACQCGWSSPEAYWHGYAIAAWRDHLAQLANAARIAREGRTKETP